MELECCRILLKQRTQVENVLDASGNVVIDPLTGAPKTETKIYRDVIRTWKY